MNENERLRDILEPMPPRLRSEAAARIEARLESALRRRDRRRALRWSLALAPALLALLLFVWARPWGGGETEKHWVLLDEDAYLTEMAAYAAAGGSLDGIFETDADVADYETDNWTDEDWRVFQEALEDFQLSDNGGTR